MIINDTRGVTEAEDTHGACTMFTVYKEKDSIHACFRLLAVKARCRDKVIKRSAICTGPKIIEKHNKKR